MNANRIPPKLTIINDLAGFGHCALAVAIPIVSTMGVQACPVPTSVFSNHMAFPAYHKTDYTPHMEDFLGTWDTLGLSFDGIFCGFLGNATQTEIIKAFMRTQKETAQTIIILDPVMGDHGKYYSSVNHNYMSNLKELCRLADILTPNLTEACFLTDMAYPAEFPTVDFLDTVMDKLHALGPKKIVITGISRDEIFYNYVSVTNAFTGSAVPSVRELLSVPAGGPSRPGTGDIFASILAADALNQEDFFTSVKKAAEFVRLCTQNSAALQIPIVEGASFENCLHLLPDL